MITGEDLAQIYGQIKGEHKPLLMETPWGKVAVVISDEALEFWNKQGYASIKVDTLGDLLLNDDGSPKENQSEIIESFMKTITVFQGKCTEAN